MVSVSEMQVLLNFPCPLLWVHYTEYALTKRTGKLFKKVLEIEGVKAKSVLHIGDNLRSDWFRPKLIGMKSVLVKSQ